MDTMNGSNGSSTARSIRHGGWIFAACLALGLGVGIEIGVAGWGSQAQAAPAAAPAAAAAPAHAAAPPAAPSGFKRVEIQKHDLGTPGHEAVQMRGEFEAGAGVPKHTHPGEEVAYILEGQVTVEIDGQPAKELKAGEAFFVPAGKIHTAKNTGKGAAKVLSTYIVEKGKPLATLVK